jgi:hypothetical protein
MSNRVGCTSLINQKNLAITRPVAMTGLVYCEDKVQTSDYPHVKGVGGTCLYST